VDVDQEGTPMEVRNGLEAFLRAMELCARHHKRHDLNLADVVLQPDFGQPVQTFDFSQAQRCIQAGERAAEQALPALQALMRPSKDNPK
jgi:NTE family protein